MPSKMIGIDASIRTFGKYLIWTAIAAVIDVILANLVGLKMPIWAIPVIASFLKSVATYVQTMIDLNKGNNF